MVTCGEAKYLHGKNAYTTSLKQINDFITSDKHISDAVILNGFVSDKGLDNLVLGNFGVCSAFSSTDIKTKDLISHICANTDFKSTLQYDYVVLVAVNIM